MNDQHNKQNPKTESSVLGAIVSYFLYSVISPLKLIGNILGWKKFKEDSESTKWLLNEIGFDVEQEKINTTRGNNEMVN